MSTSEGAAGPAVSTVNEVPEKVAELSDSSLTLMEMV